MKRIALYLFTMIAAFSLGTIAPAIKPNQQQISPQARVAEEYAVLFSKLLLTQNRTEVSYRYDGTGDETKYINRLFDPNRSPVE